MLAATTLTSSQSGEAVSLPKDGTVTVTLESAQQDGYMWRLAEVPDPSVLKVATQDYIAPPNGVGKGQEKWVFQAIGPGDVNVKMWYGNTREGSLSANPTFNFIASVSDRVPPAKKSRTVKSKKTVAEL
jgi:predicted secreted protein